MLKAGNRGAPATVAGSDTLTSAEIEVFTIFFTRPLSTTGAPRRTETIPETGSKVNPYFASQRGNVPGWYGGEFVVPGNIFQ